MPYTFMSLLRPAPASTLHVFLRDVYNNVSVEELYDRHSVFIHNIVAKHSGFAPTGPRLNTTSKLDDKINVLSAKIAELQKQLASKQSTSAKASPAEQKQSPTEQKESAPAKASPAPTEAPAAEQKESPPPAEAPAPEQKASTLAEASPPPAEAPAPEQKASTPAASPAPAEAPPAEQKAEETLTELDVTAASNQLAEIKANKAKLEPAKLTKNATIATVVLVAIVLAIQMLSGPMENERVNATELVQNITKTLGTSKRPFEYGSQSFMNLKPVQEAILTLEQQQRKQEQMNSLWKMITELYNRIVGNQ